MARTLVALIKAIIFIGIITGVKSLQCKAALTKGICPCSLSSDRKGIDCDSAPPPVTTTLPPGRVLHYLSTKAGERFQAINSEFTLEPSTKANINVKFTGEEHQRLKGFGGAFTDASAINIANLSSPLGDAIVNSYFGKGGLGYSIGRIPMAACDFSTHPYSYDDSLGDFDLINFSISEDLELKIPLIKRAISSSSRNISFFASPWSSPTWMKSTGEWSGGRLLTKAYASWALYFSKFISAYKEHEISLWAITVQNEPAAKVRWQSMKLDVYDHIKFVGKYLGPLLRKSHPEVGIFVHDDQRSGLEVFSKEFMSDPIASKYIVGFAVHWYAAVNDMFDNFKHVKATHERYPYMQILPSEACNGYLPWETAVKLGDWGRGELYSYDILKDLESYAIGWTDWNLALNTEGGPNHVGNFVDAPIIVDSENDRFYKQPMYYHIGHFSIWVSPGSIRLGVTVKKTSIFNGNDVYAIGFKTPEDNIVLVILGRSSLQTSNLVVHVEQLGYLTINVPRHSIQTLIIGPPAESNTFL